MEYDKGVTIGNRGAIKGEEHKLCDLITDELHDIEAHLNTQKERGQQELQAVRPQQWSPVQLKQLSQR